MQFDMRRHGPAGSERFNMPGVSAALDTSTAVLILGGKENSLSITRHLGSLGIEVLCSGPSNCWGMYSRFCTQHYPVAGNKRMKSDWFQLLLGPNSKQLHGKIVWPCSDEAIEFVAENHEALSHHYILDEASPEQRLNLLNKQKTLELARDAGIGFPQFWKITSPANVESVKHQIQYPVMMKPLNTAEFHKIFGQKLFIVEQGFDELKYRVEQALAANQPVMIVEMIPGPDSLLSSYYTYINAGGEPLFHFTKRIRRRYPVNRGGATFHSTRWLPETAEAGLKFFLNTGYRGLGNIEFKFDTRDQQLKIIEVNGRFTAAQELALQAKMPIDLLTYCHLTKQPLPAIGKFTEHLNYLYVIRDSLAFIQLWKKGELSLSAWIKSLFAGRWVSPLHKTNDLFPSIMAGIAIVLKAKR
jgi:predicted ATP-grasp superfamily ATP-dependent carboligase